MSIKERRDETLTNHYDLVSKRQSMERHHHTEESYDHRVLGCRGIRHVDKLERPLKISTESLHRFRADLELKES